MKSHHYTVVAFFLLLFVLQPVPARQSEQGPVFELQISASGSHLAGLQPLKVQVHEGQMSTITMHQPGQRHYQYMIRAHRPVPDSLHLATAHIASPLAISIRIDTSDDGKAWLLQTHANVIATLGSTVATELSDAEKSTSLIVSSRLVSDAEHQALTHKR